MSTPPTAAAPFLADLHLHSPYAFACSKALTLPNLAAWARRKGINLLATGDFTHPIWAEQLQSRLIPDADGLYRYAGNGGDYGDAGNAGSNGNDGVRFVPATEISCVYRQDGHARRIHLLIIVPTLDAAANFTRRLARYGNLANDGRPTVSLSARDLTDLALSTHPAASVIPAHAWTPWYGVYGSKSGFDALTDCFGDLAPQITAIESGLSSDPAMNHAIPELRSRAIVSFSDAHSPQRLGREMTAFAAPLSWAGLSAALRNRQVAYTVEFYPEEGKYHYSGHRKCGVALDTAALAANGPDCPICGRPLTLGVLHRISALSDRPIATNLTPTADGFIHFDANGDSNGNGGSDGNGDGGINGNGDGGINGNGGSYGDDSNDDGNSGYNDADSDTAKPPYARLVPLPEIISAVRGVGVNSRAVQREYAAATDALGSELNALLRAAPSDLNAAVSDDLANAILRARAGQIDITPGYDGQYGAVRIPVPSCR